MIFEILNPDGSVHNNIVADHMYMTDNFPSGNYREVIEAAVVVQQPEHRNITKLAFMNRFSDGEAIALDLASIGSTVNTAAIRRYKEKIMAATFIDLDREDTRAGVMALESLGLLAVGRALIILDSAIQLDEVYKG